MSRRPNPIPIYRCHKQSGQAIVTFRTQDGGRRDVLLGEYNTPESRAEYTRVIAEYQSGSMAGSHHIDVTVNEMLLAFRRHADQHYRRADGSQTNELNEYDLALRPVREIYGHTRAVDFGPLALKAVRNTYINAGLCRSQVNARTARVRRAFKWAVSEQLVPVVVIQALGSVAGLQRGRTPVRESEPVRPITQERVEAILPFLRPAVRAMVELQQLTGMRPGEVVRLRPIDLDRTGQVWHFKPEQHKNAHRGKSRVVAIGPQAQAILVPFTPFNPSDYFFSPRRAVGQQHTERSEARVTPCYPSHMRRNMMKRTKAPKRPPADVYAVSSYGHAIARACEKAFPPPQHLLPKQHESQKKWWKRLKPTERNELKVWRKTHRWHPNQLRHAHGTTVRERYGLEAAQVVLGHAKADVTQVYAERNHALADKVAAEMG